MESAMSLGEVVGPLCRVVAGECPLLAPITAGDIDAPALHEMAGKTRAVLLAVERAFSKFWIEQAEQPIECRLVAAMGRGRQQHQMALRIGREALEEFEALLTALVRADAGMRLIHHDEGW